MRRLGVGVDQSSWHRELWEPTTQRQQILHDLAAVTLRQTLVGFLSDLRGVQADPDLPGVLVRRPEVDELFEVTGPLNLLSGHGAVHRDLMAIDVLQNAFVGRGLAPFVVLRLEAVNRDDDLQSPQRSPRERDGTHGARDELRVNTHCARRGSSVSSSR